MSNTVKPEDFSLLPSHSAAVLAYELNQAQRRADFRALTAPPLPRCRICRKPDHDLDLINAALMGDDPDLAQIARRFSTTPRALVRHVASCMGGTPSIDPESADAAIRAFGNAVFDALRRTLEKAEDILNDLYEAIYVDDEGQIIHPHRSTDLADSYTRLAKTNAVALAGVVAHSDRKRLQAQLESLEARLAEARAAPPPPPPERPRRSLSHLLHQMRDGSPYPPPDPGADLPDPFA